MATPGPVPQEALAYWRRKQLKVGFDFRDVWRQEHDLQFTVAKVTSLDVLADIRASLDQALAEGVPFAQWRKTIKPQLQKRGWWGPREVIDETTGEITTTNLSSPRRLRTVYENNLRPARAAGQWERIQRTRRALPYLLYQIGPSIEHRVEHVAWHGTCLPADDPWWATHMPMNGWGCKCHVRQVGRAEYERLQRDGLPIPIVRDDARTRRPRTFYALDPDTGLPTGRLQTERRPPRTVAPESRMVKWTNRRTGQTERVPAGIDPGFDFNPGASRQPIVDQLEKRRAAALSELRAARAPAAPPDGVALPGYRLPGP